MVAGSPRETLRWQRTLTGTGCLDQAAFLSKNCSSSVEPLRGGGGGLGLDGGVDGVVEVAGADFALVFDGGEALSAAANSASYSSTKALMLLRA